MNSNRKQSILFKWESYIFIFQVGREAGYGKGRGPWVGRHRADGSVLGGSGHLVGTLCCSPRREGTFSGSNGGAELQQELADFLNISGTSLRPHQATHRDTTASAAEFDPAVRKHLPAPREEDRCFREHCQRGGPGLFSSDHLDPLHFFPLSAQLSQVNFTDALEGLISAPRIPQIGSKRLRMQTASPTPACAPGRGPNASAINRLGILGLSPCKAAAPPHLC